jgi:hypothetical protein
VPEGVSFGSVVLALGLTGGLPGGIDFGLRIVSTASIWTIAPLRAEP